MAVSYLTIAAGTGKGNRVSPWSAQAIEKYTGLHNTRAKVAIKELIAQGYVCLEEKSPRTRPRYTLTSIDAVAPPELIWLPNTMVTGTAKGEASPARRLRSRGDMDALRVLIDLYPVQHLSADGGVGREVIREGYQRIKCGERGRHIIWGFKAEPSDLDCLVGIEPFGEMAPYQVWEAVSVLREMRLLVVVPHLVETSEPDCELIHGFGWNGVGERLEQQLAIAADVAGRYIIGDARVGTAQRSSVQMFAPVLDTHPDVQMVGVFRRTYRPRTELTADWCRRISESAPDWLEIYERIGPSKLALHVAAGT